MSEKSKIQDSGHLTSKFMHLATVHCACVCVCVCVCVHACSVAQRVADSLQPCGLSPARILCSWNFSRLEYWSGLPFPTPGNLPDPGIKPASLVFLHWQADSLPLNHPGSPT